MIEIVDVTAIKALEEGRLWLRFSDDSEGVEDLSDLIANGGPMIVPLRDPAFFKRVFISFGVPSWPNGFDLDAINLHRKMQERGRLTKSAA